MRLTLFCNDAELAGRADQAGVDRIGPDLEILGKDRRQTGPAWRISRHRLVDLDPLREVLKRALLFVRINPLHAGSQDEVRAVLEHGCEVVMLPMVRSASEVARFLQLLDGRALGVPLLETGQAIDELDAICRIAGLTELHFGLNDLALDLGLGNRFELLAEPRFATACARVLDHGIKLGVGGVGALDADLPIPPRLVYAALSRLGASRAIVSRSFLSVPAQALAGEIRRARILFDSMAGMSEQAAAARLSELRAALQRHPRL